MTYQNAADQLKAKGMQKLRGSKATREYWGFGTNDRMGDHSATITKIGKQRFHVSDFSK